MDYIKELDIRLDKEHYYAGEVLSGRVIMHTTENFKLKSIRLLLRGKAHVEWKVFVSGDKRTHKLPQCTAASCKTLWSCHYEAGKFTLGSDGDEVKDDQVYIDERAVIWGERAGEGLDVTVPVLVRGQHQFPFRFNIPETNLPCSFESRACYIRYFVKVRRHHTPGNRPCTHTHSLSFAFCMFCDRYNSLDTTSTTINSFRSDKYVSGGNKTFPKQAQHNQQHLAGVRFWALLSWWATAADTAATPGLEGKRAAVITYRTVGEKCRQK
uniref:Arrestin_N domain-containing protein n=1 Tax=Anopheles melas TaxID=34690 RepID=A0A182TPF1_9DIPT